MSNTLKFIADRMLSHQVVESIKCKQSKQIMERFTFRLVYELIRRDYFNKALEVITGIGWSKTDTLKSILFNSSEFRMSKIILNHLSHKGKLTSVE